MDVILIQRLTEERKAWRRDHRIHLVNIAYGFWAKPVKTGNNVNLRKWRCGIPGKKGTDWEGGTFVLILEFGNTYPSTGPKCTFNPPIFHPNGKFRG